MRHQHSMKLLAIPCLLIFSTCQAQERPRSLCKGDNYTGCDGPQGQTTSKEDFYNNIIPLDGDLTDIDVSNLREKLTSKLTDTFVRIDYDDCGYVALEEIDQSDSDVNSITAFYSGKNIKKKDCITTGRSGKDNWNKEHIYPAGRWKRAKNDAYSDLHHLVAADSSINSERLDYDFKDLDGDVDSVATKDSTCSECRKNTQKGDWEPADGQKGQVARMLFYMDIRYDDKNTFDLELIDGDTVSQSKQLGDLASLKKWHCQHEVTLEERKRNDRVQKWQGNRNPFIDYPQLVEKIYNFNCNDYPAEDRNNDDTIGNVDKNGTTNEPPTTTNDTLVKEQVRIIQAEVNPDGSDNGKESVTIKNNSDEEIDLGGWTIAGNNGKTSRVCVLSPGDTFKIGNLGKSDSAQLVNRGGSKITLYDDANQVVDEVTYESATAVVTF